MNRIKNRRLRIMRRTGLFFAVFFIVNVIFFLSEVVLAANTEREVISKVGSQIPNFSVEEIDGAEFGISGKVYGGATSNVVIELSTRTDTEDKKKLKSALFDGIVNQGARDGEGRILKNFKQKINEYEVSVYEIDDFNGKYIAAWSLDFPEHYSLVAVLDSDLNSAKSEVERIYKIMISEMVNAGIVQDNGKIVIPGENSAATNNKEIEDNTSSVNEEITMGKALDEPIEVCNTDNIAGVKNGPTNPTTFTINKSHLLTYIKDYHYNYGKGAPGGTIGLKDSAGKTYGPWKVTVDQKVYWEVRPNVVLPAGTYTIIDSDPSTWSQNSESGGSGMSIVKATPNFNIIGEKTKPKDNDSNNDDYSYKSKGGVSNIGHIPGPKNTTESVVGVVVPGLVGVAVSVLAGLGGALPPMGGGGIPSPSGTPSGAPSGTLSESSSNTPLSSNNVESSYDGGGNKNTFQETKSNANNISDKNHIIDVNDMNKQSVYDFRKNKDNIGLDTDELEFKPSVENNNIQDNNIENEFDKDGFNKEGYNAEGFDRQGYDAEGYNKKGYNKAGFDREGFNKRGFDKYGYDKEGYDKYGYDKDGFNKEGFDKEGYMADGYNKDGYDRQGFDRTGFDSKGYDKDGFNREGFDKRGYDREGYNKSGFDKQGYDKEGYNTLGYDKEGFNREGFNAKGYDRQGYDIKGYDKEGYDRQGYNRDGYDKEGFNKDGIDEEGYNREGFDKDGYNRDGYDSMGFDKEGYNTEGYNIGGYNKAGYDKEGFDINGLDKEGYDRQGFDKEGFDREGFNAEGYDKEGFDREGFDEEGYGRDGYDKEGYSRSGYDRFGVHKDYRKKHDTALADWNKQIKEIQDEISLIDKAINDKQARINKLRDLMKADDYVHGEDSPFNVDTSSNATRSFPSEYNGIGSVQKIPGRISNIKEGSTNPFDFTDEAVDYSEEIEKLQKEIDELKGLREKKMDVLKELQDKKPKLPKNAEKPDTPEMPDEPEYPDEPETPEEPEYPDDPEMPQDPEYPDEPEMPQEPDYTDEPDLSQETGDSNLGEQAAPEEPEIQQPADYGNFPKDGEERTLVGATDGREYNIKFEVKTGQWINTESGTIFDPDKFEKWQQDLGEDKARSARVIEKMENREDGESERLKFIMQLEKTKEIAEKYGLTGDEEGRGDAAGKIAKILDDISNGKGYDEKNLEQIKKFIKSRITGKSISEKDYVPFEEEDWWSDTEAMKKSLSDTYKEVVTGTKEDGNTSILGMGARITIGIATGGQSEYILTIAEGMEVVKDGVEKGKSYSEIMKDVVIKVGVDEGFGRIVEGGIGITVKGTTFIAKKLAPGLTQQAGDLVKKLILTGQKGNLKFSGKLGLIDEKSAKAAVKELERQIAEIGEESVKASSKNAGKTVAGNVDEMADSVIKPKNAGKAQVEESVMSPKQKSVNSSELEVDKVSKSTSEAPSKPASNADDIEVKNKKQATNSEEPEIKTETEANKTPESNNKKDDFYKKHEKKSFDNNTLSETDAEYEKYIKDIEAKKNKIVEKANSKDVTTDDILEIKSDPGAMRNVKEAPEEARKEINKVMKEKIYKPSYDEVREKAVKKFGGKLKDYKVETVRTPGKKYKGSDINTDNDIILKRKVKGPDGKLKWEEVPVKEWKGDYYEAYAKNTNAMKNGKFDIEMAKGKYKNVDWDSMDDAARLEKWAEIHGETPTDVFDPEAAWDFSKENKGVLRGKGVNEESIIKINSETGTLVDAEGLGKMEQYKVTHYWDKGDLVSQKEALTQLEKMADLTKGIENKYNDMIRTGKINSKYSVKPMSSKMNEGIKIIKNNNLSPTRRDMELRKLGFDGPVDFADKLSIRLEFLKNLKLK